MVRKAAASAAGGATLLAGAHVCVWRRVRRQARRVHQPVVQHRGAELGEADGGEGRLARVDGDVGAGLACGQEPPLLNDDLVQHAEN